MKTVAEKYWYTFSQIISQQYLFLFITVFQHFSSIEYKTEKKKCFYNRFFLIKHFSLIEYKTEKKKCYRSCYICCHSTLNVRKTYAKCKKVVTFSVGSCYICRRLPVNVIKFLHLAEIFFFQTNVTTFLHLPKNEKKF